MVDAVTEIIDFTELHSLVPGEGLEQLVRQIGLRIGLSAAWSGRGADGGRDILFSEIISRPIFNGKVIWLVSCKDKAKSGQSVKEEDLPSTGIIDKVRQHKTDGFLLVTTTTPSTGAKALLDSLDKSNGGEIYTHVWDYSDLVSILINPKFEDLLLQFLPNSYKNLKRLTSLEETLLCNSDKMPQNVLDEVLRLIKPYGEQSLKGSIIWPYDKNQQIRLIR